MNTYTSYTEAKSAADTFFNEEFGHTNGASILTEKKSNLVKNEDGDLISMDMEFFSVEDPGMTDTFKCKIEF